MKLITLKGGISLVPTKGTSTFLTLKGESKIRLVQEGRCVLVLKDDLTLIPRNTLRLILSQGAAGNNGVDGAYNSPTPFPIVDGTTLVIQAGKKIDSISVIPAAGARILTVGYTYGSGEVVDNEEVAALDPASFHIGKYYDVQTTLHFSGFTGSVLIYLL